MKNIFDKHLSKIIIVIAILYIAFAITGCSKSPLIGIWELDRVENGSFQDHAKRIEFFSDGTGNMDGVNITWKTEKNRILIVGYGSKKSFSYELYGSTLTFMVSYENAQKKIYEKIIVKR